jgi:FkbM family methyltransferase
MSDEPEIARGIAVPLLRGPLRGMRWLPSSGGKLARFLLGSYEAEQSALFTLRVRPGQQVIDIGAAAGYYTLLAAKCVGARGSIIACEPDAANLRFLRAHIARNQLTNVRVLPLALADQNGSARFGRTRGSGRGRLSSEGASEVAVRRLDDLAGELSLRPQHLKIDVEGAELDVLLGGERLVREFGPTVFLSTHDRQVPGVQQACCDLLESWGYQVRAIGAGELLCVRDGLA